MGSLSVWRSFREFNVQGQRSWGGLIIGFDRLVAVEFSFFLAIPTMFAATGYDLLSSLHTLSLSDIPLFASWIRYVVFSALIVIKSFLRYVSRHNFSGFAYYRHRIRFCSFLPFTGTGVEVLTWLFPWKNTKYWMKRWNCFPFIQDTL